MGKLRLGRDRGWSWALTINCDRTEVAEAVSESSTGLPLFPPGSPSPQIRFRGVDRSLVGHLGSDWAALVVQLLQPEAGTGSAPGAISGSALECDPGKVTLRWVGANYRLACSSFRVLQPPGKQEASEPTEGFKGPLRAAEARSSRAGPPSPSEGRSGWGSGAGPWVLLHTDGPPFPGDRWGVDQVRASRGAHLAACPCQLCEDRGGGWPIPRGSVFCVLFYSALFIEHL